MAIAQNPAQVFSDKWDVYQKVVHGNYMHHTGFSEKTKEILSKLDKQPLRVLDIGCGDGLPVLPHLLVYGQVQYTGYDLSAPALQSAAVNLSPVNGTITLKEGNMLNLLEEETRFFDLIISSFSIHHLQDDEKMKLLENCYQHLLPGGIMIYTDVFLITQPDREAYFSEYLANIRENWTLLNEEEKQPIIEHVLQYDFPAPLNRIISYCGQLGFTVKKILQPDPWLMMLLLGKPVNNNREAD